MTKNLIIPALMGMAALVSSCGKQSGLVKKIFKICSCKSGSSLSYLLQINLLTQRFAFRMNLQDLFSSLNIWSSNHNLSVKTART